MRSMLIVCLATLMAIVPGCKRQSDKAERRVDILTEASRLLASGDKVEEAEDAADVAPGDLLASPEKWENAVVRVHGEPSFSWPALFPWSSVCQSFSSTLVYIVALNRPPIFVKERKACSVKGRFIGVHSYRTWNGDEILAPLLTAPTWEEAGG